MVQLSHGTGQGISTGIIVGHANNNTAPLPFASLAALSFEQSPPFFFLQSGSLVSYFLLEPESPNTTLLKSNDQCPV
jgi:hypothetical protein